MKKIRNFRVNLRVREIIRVVKKLTNTAEMTIEIEETTQKACRFYSDFIMPSVLYDTFSKDDISFVYEKDAPSKWVARSVFFITIGDKIEEYLKKNENIFGEHSNTILSAVAVDALEQAKNFTQRLVANEAEDDNYDISRSIDLPSDLYEKAAKVVPIDKIDISVKDGKLFPQYSICGLFYWIPSSKKKRQK
ncbi:MAG: hypothetical protein LBD46_03915 [Endomicrobium sp.]|jgi:hypothetical protein|nr:hypothetical protein [Endomicrobium sp.]